MILPPFKKTEVQTFMGDKRL